MCSLDDVIQSRLVDKAVQFHKPGERLKLKTFASDSAFKTINLAHLFVKFHM